MLGLFATSAVLLVVFLLVELKWAAEPVMPFELLHRRTPVAVAINNLVISIVGFAAVSSARRKHVGSLTLAALLRSSILHRRQTIHSLKRRSTPHPKFRRRNNRFSRMRVHHPAHREILLVDSGHVIVHHPWVGSARHLGCEYLRVSCFNGYGGC